MTEAAHLGDRIAVETTAVVVLADGHSDSAIANARGDLFEKFVAQLLATLGYRHPRREDLRVLADGIEIDVTATHEVTQQRLTAECKTYSAPVPASALERYLGPFLLARHEDETLFGLFVALPRLTPNGVTLAEKTQRTVRSFRYLGSSDVCRLLIEKGLLPSLTEGPNLHTDLTVVITEHGLDLAARHLDEVTRRPIEVVVWRAGKQVPDPVLELVRRHFADGLPVRVQGVRGSDAAPPVEPPKIFRVIGGSSDFGEYQLPAGPDYFVGREELTSFGLATARARGHAGTLIVNAKSGWGKSSYALRLAREIERAGGAALVVDSRTADRREFVAAALEAFLRDAAERNVLQLPIDPAFGSLASTVSTLDRSTYVEQEVPLLLVFDQFENVFSDEPLTREFRDLAVSVRELQLPLTVGFAWKTDLVGWTESHPYRLRDEIRATGDVVVLEPFGPRDIETLLRRLERLVGEKLHKELSSGFANTLKVFHGSSRSSRITSSPRLSAASHKRNSCVNLSTCRRFSSAT